MALRRRYFETAEKKFYHFLRFLGSPGNGADSFRPGASTAAKHAGDKTTGQDSFVGCGGRFHHRERHAFRA